jgi:DNA-binding PadR family transcriptional regulator
MSAGRIGDHKRNTTIRTVVDALVAAKLDVAKNRSSIVVSLHRLKNDGYITWPGDRCKNIELTEKGMAYLTELISKNLEPDEIKYLHENAPTSIRADFSRKDRP